LTTNFAQDFNLPINPTLNKPSDYAQYESDIIKCVTWLESNPSNVKTDKRALANRFLMAWINGAPNVTVTVHSFVMDLAKSEPEMLTLYLGGWTRYALEHPTDKPDLKCALAGLKSVIKLYKINGNSPKNKLIEKLIKLEDSNELEAWLTKNMKN
jgi:hypothetical protein